MNSQLNYHPWHMNGLWQRPLILRGFISFTNEALFQNHSESNNLVLAKCRKIISCIHRLPGKNFNRSQKTAVFKVKVYYTFQTDHIQFITGVKDENTNFNMGGLNGGYQSRTVYDHAMNSSGGLVNYPTELYSAGCSLVRKLIFLL